MYSRAHKSTTHVLEKRIFWCLAFISITLVGMYAVLISKSIVNVIVREEIEENIIHTNTKIGQLEFEYIRQKDMVTIALAESLGFSDVVEQHFVKRVSTLSARLTQRGSIE